MKQVAPFCTCEIIEEEHSPKRYAYSFEETFRFVVSWKKASIENGLGIDSASTPVLSALPMQMSTTIHMKSCLLLCGKSATVERSPKKEIVADYCISASWAIH